VPDGNHLIAVTGASGEVGRRLAARLARQQVRLRLVVRDRARAPEIAGVGVARASEYSAADEMRSAFEGVEVVFLIPAAEAADRVDQHRTAVQAAVTAGVERIVYLSCVGAASDATFTLARDHWHTEQIIRETGLAWTVLRMNLYTDFLPSMVGADGVIRGPAADGRLAAVLRDDVAAAGAAALTSEGHDSMTYELTGPEAFTMAEAAELMQRASGRAISFHDETDDEAFASRSGFGAPEFEVRGWISSYWAIRDGSFAETSDHVLALTGRPPASLEDYLAAHPQSLAVNAEV
jgi:NAD(P)H dehydrogenase (quinone)